jgi:DNA-binding transcriptional regulator YiaG
MSVARREPGAARRRPAVPSPSDASAAYAPTSITIVITSVDTRLPALYTHRMLEPKKLTEIRQKLGLPQEQMARLLGVSFASINRWEGGHSSPTGPTSDLYLALDAALRTGSAPNAILQAANSERGVFLYTLFRMAYARPRRRSR